MAKLIEFLLPEDNRNSVNINFISSLFTDIAAINNNAISELAKQEERLRVTPQEGSLAAAIKKYFNVQIAFDDPLKEIYSGLVTVAVIIPTDTSKLTELAIREFLSHFCIGSKYMAVIRDDVNKYIPVQVTWSITRVDLQEVSGTMIATVVVNNPASKQLSYRKNQGDEQSNNAFNVVPGQTYIFYVSELSNTGVLIAARSISLTIPTAGTNPTGWTYGETGYGASVPVVDESAGWTYGETGGDVQISYDSTARITSVTFAKLGDVTYATVNYVNPDNYVLSFKVSAGGFTDSNSFPVTDFHRQTGQFQLRAFYAPTNTFYFSTTYVTVPNL
ncbi:hypothetical protein ACFSDG_08945 [Pseudarcicella hirudinis]|uniref:hypothetical protein n=1 Tax=Pseudarcicella hirudinis TaxID=1079859 RepID=UPI0015A56483|nr:hypothetical protein [Pseudarcicella hirudinis]